MTPLGTWPAVGYLTVDEHWADGVRQRAYHWRGGPQLLVARRLLAEIDPAEWSGTRPPAVGERGILASFPVRIVHYDQANDRYVVMREEADAVP